MPARSGVHRTALVGGDPEVRKHVDHLHPVVLGHRVLIGPYAQVDCGTESSTTVGSESWVMASAHVGHDCVIGERCEIGSGSILCGHVHVGNDVRLGVGTVVRPFVRIGDGARTGCGTVVVRDIPAGETWAGNPARRLR